MHLLLEITFFVIIIAKNNSQQFTTAWNCKSAKYATIPMNCGHNYSLFKNNTFWKYLKNKKVGCLTIFVSNMAFLKSIAYQIFVPSILPYWADLSMKIRSAL